MRFIKHENGLVSYIFDEETHPQGNKTEPKQIEAKPEEPIKVSETKKFFQGKKQAINNI